MNGRLFPLPPVVCQVVSGKKVKGKWSAKIAVNIGGNRCSQWQVLFFLVFSILLINDLWIFNFNGLLPSSQSIEKGQGKGSYVKLCVPSSGAKLLNDFFLFFSYD